LEWKFYWHLALLGLLTTLIQILTGFTGEDSIYGINLIFDQYSVFFKLFFVLFPSEFREYETILITIGLFNLIYVALAALAQRELRLFLAYLSLAQVGVLLIGFGSQRPEGVVGAVFQQLAMGLGLTGFGLFIGILNNRTGDYLISKDGKNLLGGLARKSPLLALVSALFICSLLGVPGLGGFIGQSLIMMGSYTIGMEVLLAFGISLLLLALGLFGVYSRVFFGSSDRELDDLSMRERAFLAPLVLLLLVLGVFPKPLLELVRPSIEALLGGLI